MASALERVINLRGDFIQDEQRKAGGVITPGDLLQVGSTGTVVVHAGAGLNAMTLFALERDEIGKGIDDAYASGDNVKVGYFHSGCIVNCRVAAAAVAIAIGAYVESNGAGGVRLCTTDAATDDTQRLATIGTAEEAVDNSGGATIVRIAIRIR